MDDKKLNFNRPLLSVRRFSPTVANLQKDPRRNNEIPHPAPLPSPSYKSELHSGPLRKPGSVPFVWEQSPGRPKDEKTPQKHPIAPKLPPGRILKPKKQDLDSITKDFIVTKGPQKDTFETAKDLKKERTHTRDDDDGNGVVYRENVKPQIAYGPNFLQFNDDKDDDNEDDSESDYEEHESMSYKVCGLLPHFCLKGSIGILNPIPGLSVRNRLPISSANGTRVEYSSATSQPSAGVAAYEHKSLVKPQKDQTVVKNESTEATNQEISQKQDRSGLYDRFQGHGISNSHTESTLPPVSERKQEILQKKGLVSFKELLARENEKEADFQNPAVEKTLYVDTIHKVETAKSDFKETDVGIFGISQIQTDSFKSDAHAVDKPNQDKEMKTETAIFKDPKVDQKVKISRQKKRPELPAPPPLPKSPSDSWLWRTLPSVSLKPASSRVDPTYPSNTTAKLNKKVTSRYPQGLLLPIPET